MELLSESIEYETGEASLTLHCVIECIENIALEKIIGIKGIIE